MSAPKKHFKIGEMVVDCHAFRFMVYLGYSERAGFTGAYKFLQKAKDHESYYMIYVQPKYVESYVQSKEN